MSQITKILSKISIRTSGFGGGFIYLYGETEFVPYGIVDTYAFFSDSTEENNVEELKFQAEYSGGHVEVTSSEWEYQAGTGLSLRKIQWKNA